LVKFHWKPKLGLQSAFDVLDPTKIIPEEEVPVRRVGRLVLDRVVDNFFAETEQGGWSRRPRPRVSRRGGRRPESFGL